MLRGLLVTAHWRIDFLNNEPTAPTVSVLRLGILFQLNKDFTEKSRNRKVTTVRQIYVTPRHGEIVKAKPTQACGELVINQPHHTFTRCSDCTVCVMAVGHGT